MVRNAKKIIGQSVRGHDGEIGKVQDLRFDADDWNVRYLLVQTLPSLGQRCGLLLPEAVRRADWREDVMPVDLTQAEAAKSIATAPSAASVANAEAQRPREPDPQPWAGTGGALFGAGVAGMGAPAVAVIPPVRRGGEGEVPPPPPPSPAARLFGLAELLGRSVEAEDGAIGKLDDVLVHDLGWRVRYTVVDTSLWLPGRKVIISPLWISGFTGDERPIRVDLTRDAIKGSPPYDPSQPLRAEYAHDLHDYYGRARDSD